MYMTTRLLSRTCRAGAVLLRVYGQGADKIASEEEDRDHCKNAGAVVLFHGATARNGLNVTSTIWSRTRIGIEAAVAK